MKPSTLWMVFFLIILFGCESDRPVALNFPINQYTDSFINSDWKIRAGTLNTFSINLKGKDAKPRNLAMGKQIKKLGIDIMGFQESYQNGAKDLLIENSGLNYNKYFTMGGTLGSGNLILSRNDFTGTSFYYHLLMGEIDNIEMWSGKGIGKVSITHDELPVSFFNLHLISRTGIYSDDWEDENTTDRLIELFEVFSQVVEQTDSDAFIVVGDFNMNIFNHEYQFFNKLTNWQGIKFQEEDFSICTFCRENTFNSKSEGQLDYIWISPRLSFKNKWIDFKQLIKIDDRLSNLSDHYGLVADIEVNKNQAEGNIDDLKKSALDQIELLIARINKELSKNNKEANFDENKGVEERLCRSCQLKDALVNLKAYQKSLRGDDLVTQHEVDIDLRLNSYFELFKPNLL